MGSIPGHEKEYRVKVVNKRGKHMFNLGTEGEGDTPKYFTKSGAQARARAAQKMWPNYKALVLKRKKTAKKKSLAMNMENFLGGF